MYQQIRTHLQSVGSALLMHESLECMTWMAISVQGHILDDALKNVRRGIFTIFQNDGSHWEYADLGSILSYDIKIKDLRVRSIVERIVQRTHSNTKSLYLHPRCLQLRFGLLRLFRLACHIEKPSLISDVERFTYFVERYVNDLCCSYQAPSKLRTKTPASPITALEPRSFATAYFDVLRYATLCTASWHPSRCPDRLSSSELGLFETFIRIQRLIYRLFYAYMTNLTIFPKPVLATFTDEIRNFCMVLTAQLAVFAHWRTSLPLLTDQERREKKVDPGAIGYFESTLKASLKTLSLLGAQATKALGTEFPNKLSACRRALEQATKKINDISLEHNLKFPPFKCEQPDLIIDGFKKPDVVEGFHCEHSPSEPVNIQSRESNQTEPPQIDECSSDGSFGVNGDWAMDDADSQSSSMSSAPKLVMRS